MFTAFFPTLQGFVGLPLANREPFTVSFKNDVKKAYNYKCDRRNQLAHLTRDIFAHNIAIFYR